MESPRDVPINEDGTRKCWWCKGLGSATGRIWGTPGSPWGVRTCPTCKGVGKLTEAQFEKMMEQWDSIPTEEEVNERNKGEEWKQ
jgi:DnaJ-class molecular chaperone